MKSVKFRASANGKLMTKGRKKDEALGQTSKTMIEELFLFNEFGYREEVQTKQMKKGHICEVPSMDLIQQVLGGPFRTKNLKHYSNEYLTGTPDIVLEDSGIVEDVKNSWNLRTFFQADGTNKDYYWQGQTYMELTGTQFFRLIYVLNPIPEELMVDEERKLYYQFGQDDQNEDYKAALKQLLHNNDLIYALEPQQRVKIFTFERNDDDIKKLYEQANAAREYYKTLEL
jgi:hypothetical protein